MAKCHAGAYFERELNGAAVREKSAAFGANSVFRCGVPRSMKTALRVRRGALMPSLPRAPISKSATVCDPALRFIGGCLPWFAGLSDYPSIAVLSRLVGLDGSSVLAVETLPPRC
jgi:hypothetical protein